MNSYLKASSHAQMKGQSSFGAVLLQIVGGGPCV